MTQPTDHDLNQLLAKWAGVDVYDLATCGILSITNDEGAFETKVGHLYIKRGSVADDEFNGVKVYDWDEWDPFTDANQLELVKAGLRKEGIGYSIWWKPVIYHATLFRPGVEGDPLGVGMHHESEAMALTLAIQAMEQEK